MFSHHSTSADIVRHRRDALMGSADRHRLVFGEHPAGRSFIGRRSRHAAAPQAAAELAEIVALPARSNRTSPRDSRVA